MPKTLILILALNILVIILIIISRGNLPPVVPLFYGNPFGGEQLAPSIYLVIPPTLSILVVVVNTTLSKLTNEDFIKNVLFGSTIVTTLLSTITVIKIVLLVGSF